MLVFVVAFNFSSHLAHAYGVPGVQLNTLKTLSHLAARWDHSYFTDVNTEGERDSLCTTLGTPAVTLELGRAPTTGATCQVAGGTAAMFLTFMTCLLPVHHGKVPSKCYSF